MCFDIATLAPLMLTLPRDVAGDLLHLLIAYRASDYSLPADPEILAGLCRVDPADFKRRSWPLIHRIFTPVGNGELLACEMIDGQRRRSDARAAAGAIGGAKSGKVRRGEEPPREAKVQQTGSKNSRACVDTNLDTGLISSMSLPSESNDSLPLLAENEFPGMPPPESSRRVANGRTSTGKRVFAPDVPKVEITPGLEPLVQGFLRAVAGANDSGKITESRYMALRTELCRVLEMVGDPDFLAYALLESVQRGKSSIGYVRAVALNALKRGKQSIPHGLRAPKPAPIGKKPEDMNAAEFAEYCRVRYA
jgi:hypothetical protein